MIPPKTLGWLYTSGTFPGSRIIQAKARPRHAIWKSFLLHPIVGNRPAKIYVLPDHRVG